MINIPHQKFCVLPWVSLETSPIGTVRPCCLSKEEIVDNENQKFDLKTACFDDIRNSDHMRKLRREFIENRLPASCQNCWTIEESGGTSKRQHTLDRLKHMVKETHWTEDPKDLVFLDLKLGNICNLKCRICGPWSSSTFAAEEVSVFNKAEQKLTYAYKMLQLGRWPRENNHFWHELESAASQIRYLEFTGGEPFLINEHFDFLERLVNNGLAHNIEIHYNTNCTTYPTRGIELWPHFKLVEIAVSIDDIGPRYEYQRSGADWDQVNDNLQALLDLRSKASNIELQLCCTLSIWNVLYFNDIAKWASSIPWNLVFWNYLHDSPVWCIANVLDSVKKKIHQYLHDGDTNHPYSMEIEKICNFMHSREGWIDHGFGGILNFEISKLDIIRRQTLRDIAPELATIIDYHAPNPADVY
jgi:MoaA/NifB/PqqE/SkfB family radical SAM enzyme